MPATYTQPTPTYRQPLQTTVNQPQVDQSLNSPSIPESFFDKWKAIIIGLVVLAAAVFAFQQFFGFNLTKTRTITVNASAVGSVPAQKADIVVRYLRSGSDLAGLINSSNLTFSNVVNQLQNLSGVTVSQAQAQTDRSGGISSSYDFQKVAKIVVTDLSSIDRVMQILYDSDISVVSTFYTPDLADQSRSQIMEQAVANAHIKAKQLAGATNNRVGKVVGITETSTSDQSSNTTETVVGNNNSVEVTTQVNVTFELAWP